MIKTHTNFIIITFFLIIFTSCTNNSQNNKKTAGQRGICEESSEWRDNNGADSCSFYSQKESCKKIIGRLNIKSRLHKNFMGENIFGGGMSSRWFEIDEKTIKYFKPSGELDDEGKCNCNNGILSVIWKKSKKRPLKYEIYFKSIDFVELRYHDYPFNFNAMQYDKSKPPSNPTKIIGTMR